MGPTCRSKDIHAPPHYNFFILAWAESRSIFRARFSPRHFHSSKGRPEGFLPSLGSSCLVKFAWTSFWRLRHRCKQLDERPAAVGNWENGRLSIFKASCQTLPLMERDKNYKKGTPAFRPWLGAAHDRCGFSAVSLELDLAAIRGHPVKSGQQLWREGRRWVLL